MILNSRVLLAVGAHPDDIELGCGGTICAAVKAGVKVVAVYLTRGEKSGNSEDRVSESRQALAILGVTEVYFGNFPDTEIPSSHEPVEFLEKICERFHPDAVLTHTINDSHQDHRQVGWLSLSAFRNVLMLLAYESPRVTGQFAPTYFVDVSDCTNSKRDALKCHSSQKKKRYIAYESMINLASFRGSQVSVRAAEAFEVLRYVEKPV